MQSLLKTTTFELSCVCAKCSIGQSSTRAIFKTLACFQFAKKVFFNKFPFPELINSNCPLIFFRNPFLLSRTLQTGISAMILFLRPFLELAFANSKIFRRQEGIHGKREIEAEREKK